MPDEDDDYFVQRVMEEVIDEGEDVKRLDKKSGGALRQLAQKIAEILGTTIQRVLDALERIMDMFS